MTEEIGTSAKLDKYEELELKIKNNQNDVNEKRNKLDIEKNELLASILTPEQKEKMDEINAEFQRHYDVLNNNLELISDQTILNILKIEIQGETLGAGVTIRGLKNPKKMCVYTPEKIKTTIVVNTEMLKGMTVNIPKLKECWHEETETTPAKVAIR
jgi:hypothetical protein